MARYARSSGHGSNTTTKTPCAPGCRIWTRKSPWPWRRPSAGRGWPICWRNWAIPSISAHPPVIRALAKHEAKTDRCDSDRLGKFQLRGILPESYLAPPEVRQRRERTRYRMALSALRTAVKNRAQAILHRHGILHDFSDLFGKAGRRFLDDLALPDGSRQALQGCLELLDSLTLLIDEVEQWMVENLEEDDIVRLLMTIPGVGLILAHVIRAEIGEIERFPTFRHLASYAGLAPMSDDTAGREGPRHCSIGLQPRAALGLHRGRAWRATDERPARLSAAATLRPAVRPGPAEGPQEFGESGRRPRAFQSGPRGVDQACAVHRYAAATARQPSTVDVNPRRPQLRRQHCARTSPVTLWSAAGQPSARPVCNWAVRCRIPILCRAGRLAAGNGKVPVASGCPNT